MPDFFDYDPYNNVTTSFSFDENTGEASIHYEADDQLLMDHIADMRNSGQNDRGIRASWWTYAKLSPIWQLKLRARGFKLDGSDDTKRLLAEINTHAPHLKCTQLQHGEKLKVIHDLAGKTTEGV